jgi:hypothetical protein
MSRVGKRAGNSGGDIRRVVSRRSCFHSYSRLDYLSLLPSGLSEVEEEALEENLIEKCIEIFDETGLLIVCAAFDSN